MSARTPADPASAFADLWERDNADAEAMLMAVGAVDLWRVVLVACDCAETALRYVPAGADGPRIAIETARAWARGEASAEDVRVAAAAAWPTADDASSDDDARLAYAVRAYARADAARAEGRVADAARFVARANAARFDARAAAFAARAAARAAAYAASAVFADAPSALAARAAESAASADAALATFDDWTAVHASALRSMAPLVRRHIPLDVIARAIVEHSLRSVVTDSVRDLRAQETVTT